MADELAVRIPVTDGIVLDADLVTPDGATGVVVFAHGSGSSRHSVRNRAVAGRLQQAALATLLLDLLTPEEEAVDQRTGQHRFDVGLLATRLAAAAEWVAGRPDLAELPIGYFGASTGAAGALIAAADHPERIGAVVSRGGRVDLAGEALARVRCPTLLIVGANDPMVLELNRQALGSLHVRDCARGRARRDAPVRGARGARCGRRPRHEMVRHPPGQTWRFCGDVRSAKPAPHVVRTVIRCVRGRRAR